MPGGRIQGFAAGERSDVFKCAGNREHKRCTRAFICHCPQTATVSFDDGTTNRQTHAHAVIFGRVKCVEDFFYVARIEADANVAYGQPSVISMLSFGCEQELPRSIVYVAHRLRSVANEVKDDLLKLYAVTRDE